MLFPISHIGGDEYATNGIGCKIGMPGGRGLLKFAILKLLKILTRVYHLNKETLHNT